MRLTTVLSCVNNNPEYYNFIPYQIKIWKHLKIKFIAVFVGNVLPEELLPYKDNIILWNYTPELPSSFVAQNLRLYIPAILTDLLDDELVMITDMDMLPGRVDKYTRNLENYKKEDFITYREIPWCDRQVYMCYNAGHPKIWSKIFNINSINDIITRLKGTCFDNTSFEVSEKGWYIDQRVLFSNIIHYPHWKILNRDFIRLEYDKLEDLLVSKELFINDYDDIHFFRNFINNKEIADVILNQIEQIHSNKI